MFFILFHVGTLPRVSCHGFVIELFDTKMRAIHPMCKCATINTESATYRRTTVCVAVVCRLHECDYIATCESHDD